MPEKSQRKSSDHSLFYLPIEDRRTPKHPDIPPGLHQEYVSAARKYHDKLFPGDSKRVPLPWNRQIAAAFPASIGT
jgi:hypothetical protein